MSFPRRPVILAKAGIPKFRFRIKCGMKVGLENPRFFQRIMIKLSGSFLRLIKPQDLLTGD